MTLPKGASYSAALHLTILALLLFGLPNFLHRKIDPEPMAISVDILPIAPMSNIKPQEQPPEKTEKKPVEEKKTEKKATTQTKSEKSSAEPLPVSAKDVVKEKKNEPDKKKVEKKKDDDLDSILKSVKQTAKADESKKPTEQKSKAQPDQHKAVSPHYDASLPLSMSEKDAIRNQLQKCWVPPAGAKDLANLAVLLHITIDAAGNVTNVELARDTGRYNSDSFFRAAGRFGHARRAPMQPA